MDTAPVGVTVVVLAVNFLAQVFTGPNVDILTQGAGIALPIAALGVFIGFRAWATHQNRESNHNTKSTESDSPED